MMASLGNLVAPVVGLVFAAAFVAFTYDLPLQSRVFAFVAAGLVAVFGLVLLVQESLAARNSTNPAVRARSKAPLVYGLSLAFVAAFATAGFAVASLAYLFVSQVLLRERWPRAALVALGMTAFYYIVFKTILGVQL